jgi:hypothetical protein
MRGCQCGEQNGIALDRPACRDWIAAGGTGATSTPSLPWRFPGGTGGHGRALAIKFLLQIEPSRTCLPGTRVAARARADVPVSYPRVVVCSQNTEAPGPGHARCSHSVRRGRCGGTRTRDRRARRVPQAPRSLDLEYAPREDGRRADGRRYGPACGTEGGASTRSPHPRRLPCRIDRRSKRSLASRARSSNIHSRVSSSWPTRFLGFCGYHSSSLEMTPPQASA